MSYIVTGSCLGCKDRSCVDVCPVDCFYDIRRRRLNDRFGLPVAGNDGAPSVGMLTIDPDECIACGACVTECPVEAIVDRDELDEVNEIFIEVNWAETAFLTVDERRRSRCRPRD